MKRILEALLSLSLQIRKKTLAKILYLVLLSDMIGWPIGSKPQKNSLLSNSPIYHLGRIFFQKLLKFSVLLMSDNDACLGILSDRTQLHVGVFTS